MYRMTHERCLTSSGLARVGCPAISVRGGRAMGRGRAKAKQTKVARQLKYHTPDTDLRALERELAGSKSRSDESFERFDDNDEEYEDSRWSAPDR